MAEEILHITPYLQRAGVSSPAREHRLLQIFIFSFAGKRNELATLNTDGCTRPILVLIFDLDAIEKWTLHLFSRPSDHDYSELGSTLAFSSQYVHDRF
jgi:hypothetical protein